MAAFLETKRVRKVLKTALNGGFTDCIWLEACSRNLSGSIKPRGLLRSIRPVKFMAQATTSRGWSVLNARKPGISPILLAIVSLLFGCSIANAATQAEWEIHQNITDTAISYLESLPPVDAQQTRIEITAGKLDQRLKLAKCSTPLEPSLPGQKKAMGRISVEISCTSNKAWKIRLPVAVSVYVPVAIAAKPLPRNKQLTKSDFFFEERDISKQFKGYYTKIEDINGLLARTQIRSNTVLNPGLVRPPRLVKRGQSVDLFIKTTGFEIHGEGKALSDGARGDLIRVKNNRSSKIVEGTVVGPGRVRIGRHE